MKSKKVILDTNLWISFLISGDFRDLKESIRKWKWQSISTELEL